MVRAVSHGLSPLEIQQETAAVRKPKDTLDEGAREFVPRFVVPNATANKPMFRARMNFCIVSTVFWRRALKGAMMSARWSRRRAGVCFTLTPAFFC